MFREGLARMLDQELGFEIVGQCASASSALASLSVSGATMVLLDVDLGDDRAVDFVKGAKRKGFEGYILIVTAGISDQEAIQLIQAGVAGILHKHHSTEVLCGTHPPGGTAGEKPVSGEDVPGAAIPVRRPHPPAGPPQTDGSGPERSPVHLPRVDQ